MTGPSEVVDRRRREFLQVALAVIAGNLALVLWLVSAERAVLDTLLVWLGTFALVPVAWTILVDERRPRLSLRRQPGALTADSMLGIVSVVAFGVLNATWNVWLPGLAAGAMLPISLLPNAFYALRLGLTVILAMSLTVVAWIVFRVLLPAPVAAPGANAQAGSP